MRKIHRRAQLVAISAMLLSAIGPAFAADSAFSLPGVSLPSGSDEVRAADGTSCRSAVGNGGAYLDIGVIGNPNALGGGTSTTASSTSAYGRIVIPLGRPRNRIDCSRLYDLEVRRLEVELKLMEMGVGRPVDETSESEPSTSSAKSDNEFTDDGWTQDGLPN